MPQVQKESHEYQAKYYKKKNDKGNQNHFNAAVNNNISNQQKDMIVGNSSYHGDFLKHKRNHNNARKVSNEEEKNAHKKLE